VLRNILTWIRVTAQSYPPKSCSVDRTRAVRFSGCAWFAWTILKSQLMNNLKHMTPARETVPTRNSTAKKIKIALVKRMRSAEKGLLPVGRSGNLCVQMIEPLRWRTLIQR
jgi:hypothetical protein